MEKMGKKRAAVVIAAALIVVMLVCLAGCQSGGNEPDPTMETTGAIVATTEATGEPTSETTEGSEPTSKPTEPSEETTEPTNEVTAEPTRGEEKPSVGNTESPTEPKETEPKPTNPPATQPPETQPKPTNPPAMEVPGTEPKPTNPPATEHTHSYTSSVTKQPTCTAEGVKTYECSCGDYYTESISKTNHSMGGWTTTKEPTESASGSAERKCTVCGYTETNTLDKLAGHTCEYGVWVETSPTCTTAGYYTRSCSCGATETKDSYKPATGHSYGVVDSKAATCTTDGYNSYKCSGCGDTYSDTVKGEHAWGHTHTDEVGHDEWYVMCHCGGWSCLETDYSSAAYAAHVSESGNPADHSYYSAKVWVVDVPASDTYECTVCGASK